MPGNVFIINAHEHYPFSEGKLNAALVDRAKLILSSKGYRVQVTTMQDEYEVATVVVGLPRSLSGDEGRSAAKARELGAAVGAATGCEIEFADERFTTVQAESALLEAGMKRRRRRETVDMVAAAVMLQGHLDAENRE
jgi:putative Holliday junction resolvase